MENAITDLVFVFGYGLAILLGLAIIIFLLALLYAIAVSAFKWVISKLMKEYTITYFNSDIEDVVKFEARLYAISRSDAVRRFRIRFNYKFKVTDVTR